MRYAVLTSLVVAAGLLAGGNALSGQQAPPIPGATGTVGAGGSEGEKATEGAQAVIAGAADGIRHLFHRPKKTAQGGEIPNASGDVLNDFKNGTRVVVHYTADTDDARQSRGVVTGVDRRAKTIRISFADGTEETLRLSSDTAPDVDVDDASDAIVYYTDQNGRRVAHYFARRAG